MIITKFLNSRRLRDYPRLFLIASWLVLLVIFLFRQGWSGGIIGKLIGSDFISNYSGGILYTSDLTHLYDITAQQQIQQKLVAPTVLVDFAPFISPPYVAFMSSWMAAIPLSYAFVIWEVLILLCVIAAVYLIYKFIIPEGNVSNGFTPVQLGVIIFSSFAFILGFFNGQSHGLTLLLCTGIIICTLREKWFLAGFLGSILIYKPQFILGFIICWIIWKQWKTLLYFVLFTLLWQLPVILEYGILPYLDYLNFTRLLLLIPFTKDSFFVSTMATPYAFLMTLLPFQFQKGTQLVYFALEIAAVIFLIIVTWKSRFLPVIDRQFALVIALLIPLIIAPHTLIYDWVLLIPAFVLLSLDQSLHKPIKIFGIIFYLGVLLLPLMGYMLKIALPGILPVIFFGYLILYYFRSKIALVSS